MRKFLIIVILLVVGFIGDAAAQLNRPYFYTRGRDYIIAGRYGDAIESLNLLLRSQPEEYEGYFLRGVAKYNLNDLIGASSDFSKAIEYNPVYTQAYQYRGITFSRLGKYNQALEDFGRAIEMRPNFSGAYYSRAVTSFLNQQFAASVADYDQFLRFEPMSAEGYVNRGTAKLYLKDTVAAMNDYNTAVAVNPYLEDGYLRRGVVHLVKGETDKGIKDMDSALEIDSTAAIGYFYRAMGNSTKGNIIGALDDFGSAIHYDPTNSVAIFNRALLRSQIGDYNRAVDDYTLVAQQNPNNVLVYYNRAAVYAQLGDYYKAIDDYTKAIEIYGDFANAYLYRSQLKAALRDKKGYNEDRRKAQELIDKYRNELNVSGDRAFADTSARFSDIISFNADFEDNNLSRLSSKTLSKYRPMEMFKLEIIEPKSDKSKKYNPLEFDNEKVLSTISTLNIKNLEITNKPTNLKGWQLMKLDTLYSKEQGFRDLFALAIVNADMKNYSEAIEIYNFLVTDNPTNPLPYLNRAITEAQMTEFMSTVEGEYQSLTSQDDPAERLHNTKNNTKPKNYSTMISDLERAAELLPEMPHIYYNLGYMYTLKGDLPRAIESYSKAIELYPYFAEAYYNRGLVQLSLDEKEKGSLDLSRAGELGIEDAYTVINSITKK